VRAVRRQSLRRLPPDARRAAGDERAPSQLALLYDGVMVAGGLDAGGDPGAAGVRAARALVEAATP
jgi:hypothetical protein